MKVFFVFLFFVFNLSLAQSKSYHCPVSEKYDAGGNIYTQEIMEKYKFSVNVIDMGDAAILERCSFSSSAGAVTCDSYDVDHIERDSMGGDKYYYFRGMADIQIINSLFIENNGRGGIAFGNCEDKS